MMPPEQATLLGRKCQEILSQGPMPPLIHSLPQHPHQCQRKAIASQPEKDHSQISKVKDKALGKLNTCPHAWELGASAQPLTNQGHSSDTRT